MCAWLGEGCLSGWAVRRPVPCVCGIAVCMARGESREAEVTPLSRQRLHKQYKPYKPYPYPYMMYIQLITPRLWPHPIRRLLYPRPDPRLKRGERGPHRRRPRCPTLPALLARCPRCPLSFLSILQYFPLEHVRGKTDLCPPARLKIPRRSAVSRFANLLPKTRARP